MKCKYYVHYRIYYKWECQEEIKIIDYEEIKNEEDIKDIKNYLMNFVTDKSVVIKILSFSIMGLSDSIKEEFMLEERLW